MADDVALNPMSGGSVVATDEVSGTGEHVQVVKLAQSADGDRTPIDADADGIKVKVAWRKNLGTSVYSVGDEALPIAAVDTVGNYSPLTIGSNSGLVVEVAGGTLPVSLASSVAVTQSGAWTVAATQAGTWNIGSIATVPTHAVTQSSGPWTVVERGATIAHGSASVTTSSAQILASSSTRRSVTIQNLGTDYIYIGATGITANNGLRVAAGQTAVIDKSPNAAIYAIAASGTQTVSYLTESD